jgi:hypothetical protein
VCRDHRSRRDFDAVKAIPGPHASPSSSLTEASQEALAGAVPTLPAAQCVLLVGRCRTFTDALYTARALIAYLDPKRREISGAKSFSCRWASVSQPASARSCSHRRLGSVGNLSLSMPKHVDCQCECVPGFTRGCRRACRVSAPVPVRAAGIVGHPVRTNRDGDRANRPRDPNCCCACASDDGGHLVHLWRETPCWSMALRVCEP